MIPLSRPALHLLMKGLTEMGIYINPLDGSSKESWLEENALEIGRQEAENFYKGLEDVSVPPVALLLVLIDNGPFTACGVAYNKDEAARMLNPNDPRPRRYFMANLDQLDSKVGLDGFDELYRRKLWRAGKKV